MKMKMNKYKKNHAKAKKKFHLNMIVAVKKMLKLFNPLISIIKIIIIWNKYKET